jgi:hypothetical protein
VTDSGTTLRLICEVPGCDRFQKYRGLCGAHYESKRLGRPITPKSVRQPWWGVATVCLSSRQSADFVIWWANVAEALEADRELLSRPCRRSCVGHHLIVVYEGDRQWVQHSVHRPPPKTLEQELIECYGPHDPDRHLPYAKPEHNPPLYVPAATTLAEWEADDKQVALSAGAQYIADCLASPLDDDEDEADRWLMEHDKEMAQ